MVRFTIWIVDKGKKEEWISTKSNIFFSSLNIYKSHVTHKEKLGEYPTKL